MENDKIESVSCEEQVLKWKDSYSSSENFNIYIPCAIFLGLYSISLISFNNVSSSSGSLLSLLFPIIFIAFFVLFVFIILISKKPKATRFEAEATIFLRYCKSEKLICDKSGISGTTSKYPFEIPYSEIKSVYISPVLSTSKSEEKFKNDVLIINTAQNIFKFHSFKNCKELKNFIDEKKAQ